MNIYADKRNYHIKSSTSSWQQNLDIPKNESYDRVSCNFCSVPKSFYLVEDGRNTFVINDGKTSQTITISPGNYTSKTFGTVVAGALGTDFKVALNEGTSRYTFSSTKSNISFSVGSYLNEQLGFSSGATVNLPCTSTQNINMQVESVLYLHTDLINITKNGDDILCDLIADNTVNNSPILYKITDYLAESKPIIKTSTASRWWLTDVNNDPIDLNGLAINLSITLWRENQEFHYALKGLM